MINIGILRKELKTYSQRRLFEEAKKLANPIHIHPKHLVLHFEDKMHITYKNKSLDNLNVVLPRISDRYLNFGIMAVNHMENMGIPIVNSSDTILACKNKYLTNIRLKKHKIPQPHSYIALSSDDLSQQISRLNYPLVIKLLSATEGKGISKVSNVQEAKDLIDTMQILHKPIYLQNYIKNKGFDLRLFCIGNEVFASMKRVSQKGEWKSNIALGAKGVDYKPTPEIKELALKAHFAMGTEISGVDIIIDPKKGPLVLEVNNFAWFEGLEKATKKNVAKEIIKYTIKKAKQ